MQNNLTVEQIIAHAKKPGIFVYACCDIDEDDSINVRVIKSDFIEMISQWPLDHVLTRVIIVSDDDIVYG